MFFSNSEHNFSNTEAGSHGLYNGHTPRLPTHPFKRIICLLFDLLFPLIHESSRFEFESSNYF